MEKLKPLTFILRMVPVRIDKFIEDLNARFRKAYAGINMTLDTDQATSVVDDIGRQTRFIITGDFEIFETDPVQPPTKNAYATTSIFHVIKIQIFLYLNTAPPYPLKAVEIN